MKGHSCTSLNKIEVYAEFHSHTLLKEINQRFEDKNYFAEAELLLILYHLVSAVKHLQEKGISVEDLRPATVFLAPDVRLADRAVNLGSQGSYMLAAKQQARVLLSPE